MKSENKKAIGLFLSLALALCVAVPGTLALSTDQAATNGELIVTEETPTPTPEVTETPTPTEEPKTTEPPVPSETEKPAGTEAPKECTCSAAEGEAHKEGCPLYAAPEQLAEAEKTCTCDPKPAEGEAHKEGCPLCAAPEQPAEAEKTCTCDPKPAEDEAHKEGCPLYAEPELDIDELYSRLMAMQTQEEIVLVLMELSPETIAKFTYEQATAIEAHFDSLSTTAVVSGDTMTPGDETVVGSSEVRYITYDFTYAAPFKDPVEGGN